ncbi:hypothetical protein NKH18_42445 [Streptomyces sp. M10(2022)]
MFTAGRSVSGGIVPPTCRTEVRNPTPWRNTWSSTSAKQWKR